MTKELYKYSQKNIIKRMLLGKQCKNCKSNDNNWYKRTGEVTCNIRGYIKLCERIVVSDGIKSYNIDEIGNHNSTCFFWEFK